jgi:hypothetical protein
LNTPETTPHLIPTNLATPSTATSEVLQVISSSPGDLQSVFAAMLENAVRICDSTFGNIYRWEDDALHLVAAHNTPPAWVEERKRFPLPVAKNPDIGRMIVSKMTLHVTDPTASAREEIRGAKGDPRL